ncbi:TPA: hypothetical protein ACGVAU_002038 [Vibrio vulnificus]|uniref:hypothetical protein n=1 Tax=Vibrio vulnificus TaxID=672 RepID=UPI0019D4437C|nr:hypothetical protein [Vibrio vulnificus]MBN8103443.1 hypothetical protein [Vibrio vulnificus]
MVSRVHGNDDWWCGGDVLSFLFFAAELSSAFFLILVILASAGTNRTASGVAWYYRFIAGVAVGLFYVVAYCGKCIFKRGIRRVWMNGFPCARE